MAAPVIPPAGVSAASFFSPYVVDPAHPPALLADDIDPLTGDVRSMFAAPDPVSAAIAYQFGLLADSGAAVRGQGCRLKKIKKQLGDVETQARQEVDRIFAPFLADKLVDPPAVEFKPGTSFTDRSMAALNVVWKERLTGTRPKIPSDSQTSGLSLKVQL